MKWLVCIILFLAVEVHASKVCEDGMANPARRFLRALRSAVAHGAVGAMDLEWMATQTHPSNPSRTERKPENLSFKNSLQREVSLITSEEWPLIVTEARSLRGRLQADENKTQGAREDTRSIFGLIPIDFEFPAHTELGVPFTSTKGEVFIAMVQRNNMFIYNISTKVKLPIEDIANLDEKSTDFFERSSGEVVFAINDQGKLKVYNVSTGTPILDYPRNGAYIDRRPILYEANGMLNILLGTKDARAVEPHATIATHNLQMVPGHRFPILTEIDQIGHAVRLEDNHLYVRKVRKNGKRQKIQLKDMTLDKDLYDIEIEDPFIYNALSHLIYDRGPKLIFPGNDQQWFEVDPINSRTNLLMFKGDPDQQDPFSVHAGRALKISHFERDEGHYLLIENVTTGDKKEVHLPKVPEDCVFVLSQHTLKTAKGTWVYGWEQANARRMALHMYNLDTEEIVDVPLTPNVGQRNKIFYSPEDGRIYMSASEGTSRDRRLFQIFGPEPFN